MPALLQLLGLLALPESPRHDPKLCADAAGLSRCCSEHSCAYVVKCG